MICNRSIIDKTFELIFKIKTFKNYKQEKKIESFQIFLKGRYFGRYKCTLKKKFLFQSAVTWSQILTV